MSDEITLERVQALVTRGPYHQWLDLKVIALHEDGIELKATWREEWVVNPDRRYTHGGILATLIDSVMSAAVHTMLPAGKSYLTRELSVTFHLPVFEKTGEIMAEGWVVSFEADRATAEGRIIASDQRVYATGRATCAIFGKSSAAAGSP